MRYSGLCLPPRVRVHAASMHICMLAVSSTHPPTASAHVCRSCMPVSAVYSRQYASGGDVWVQVFLKFVEGLRKRGHEDPALVKEMTLALLDKLGNQPKLHRNKAETSVITAENALALLNLAHSTGCVVPHNTLMALLGWLHAKQRAHVRCVVERL